MTISGNETAFLAAIVGSSDDAIISKTLQGVVLTWNTAAERLFGYTAEEMIGQSIVRLIPAERLHEEERILSTIRRGERLEHYQTIRIRKDGSRIDVSLTVSPIVSTDGSIIGASKIARDVTRHQQSARANAYLAAIVTSSDDAIIAKTLDGTISSWNAAAERLFGYTADEIIGESILRLVPSDRRHEEEDILATIRRGKRWEHYETVRRRKDGSLVRVAITVSPVLDASGTIIGASKIARDITKQDETAAQQRAMAVTNAKFRTFFEQGSYFAGVMELDGTLLEANRLSLEACGFTRKDVVGKKFWDCGWWNRSPALMEMVREGIRLAAAGTLFRRESRYFLADGSERMVDLLIAPVKDDQGQVIFLVPTGTDITDRKLYEDKLRTLAGQLELLVQERTRELVASQDRLRALGRELDLAEQRERNRLATELHDHLQQLLVLTKIKMSQLKRLTPGMPACLDIIESSDQVLSDALKYTRGLVAELSPPVLREHGLALAVKWLADHMRKYDFQVTVEVPEHEPIIPEDQAGLLFQSVRELLFNSYKHARTGHASVHMTWQDDMLKIEVQDKGEGFEPATLFTDNALDESSTKFGLFSIRERMLALGGSFDLDSERGKGTIARLRLPLRYTPLPTSTPPFAPPDTPVNASQPDQDKRIRVLLVDDHVMVREGLRAMLQSYPELHLVGEAGNGDEALTLVQQFRPRVVVMDINMPKCNGIEATARIKAQFPHIHVIGLSVNVDAVNQEAMKRAGARVLLTKEAAAGELYQAINDIVTTGLTGDEIPAVSR
ncbi:hypothetical protein W02_31580 [Nitrospira sp. KM1]|uniref:PAS domain S-box protein n=1 Tax=Nitrospira sp. KM1 TaxID=1936990 RepID=UPI0013A75D69|nr:PAS domain S-box protein [Nitrospira sp. KM1]BCA56018.1 hypothetical protein W02_31580 [Nitrospira sp. KM1]